MSERRSTDHLLLELRAQRALERGEVDQTHMASKEAVLEAVRAGVADCLSVGRPSITFESVALRHFALRFHDRQLGDLLRAATLRGFGLGGV